MSTELRAFAKAEADRLGLDWGIVDRLIQTESSWNPKAIGPVLPKRSERAIGLTQLLPSTAKDLGVNPYDEKQNITGGLTYLKQNLDRYQGDYEKALASHNWGPNAVAKYGMQNMPAETRNYLGKIMGDKKSALSAAEADFLSSLRPSASAKSSTTGAQSAAYDSAEQQFLSDLAPPSNPVMRIDVDGVADDQPSALQRVGSAFVDIASAPTRAVVSGVKQLVNDPKGTAEAVGRQLGLSARAPVDAALGIAAIPGNAITAGYNLLTGKNVPFPSETYRGWSDQVFPAPRKGVESFSNTVASAGYGPGLLGLLSKSAAPATAIGNAVKQGFTANMGSQVAGSSTGAGATDLLLQGEVSPYLAVPAGIAVGMAGGRTFPATERAALRFATSADSTNPATVRATSERVAQSAGVELEKLPFSVRSAFDRLVRDSLAQNAPIDDVQIQRWLKLQAAGVKNPTKAMVSRDPYDWAEEDRLRKLSGIGAPLQDAYKAAGDAVREGVRPSTMPGDSVTGAAVRGDLRNVASDLKSKKTAAYNAALASPEVMQGVPITGLRQWMNQQESRWATQPEYKSAFDELKRLAGDRPSMTQGNYEQLRQFVNSLAKPDRSNTQQIAAIKSAIDDNLFASGQSPAFREAREANTIYRATVSDQGLVSKLLEMSSRVDPRVGDDAVYSTLMNSSPNQIKQVKNTLAVAGKDSSWNVLKDRVREDLTTTLNQGQTTADRASSFIRKFENNKEQYKAIFTPEEFAQIKNARDAAEFVMQNVGGSAVNNSNTSSAIVEYMRKAGNSLGPILRPLNAALLGLPGAVLDSGAASMAARRSAEQVRSAMTPGLLSPSPRVPNPVLTPGLLGAIYGAQQPPYETQR